MRMLAYSDNYFLFYIYYMTAVHEIARRAMNGARLFLILRHKLLVIYHCIIYKFDTIDIEKGTTDRRLVTNILVKKVTKPFADGGYFFKLFIYSISMVTIIEIIINTMYKISKSLIK